MFEHANRTLIATVLFVDVVDYSEHAVSEQILIKTRFNDIVADALAGVAATERMLLDTGDGAAICFWGDPESALFVANSLRDGAAVRSGSVGFELRMGITLGPIKAIKDVNGQPNVIGEAINSAQRVMTFAEPRQILVSRTFYELVSCLKPEYGRLFHYLGIRQDKHVREHEIYAVQFSEAGPLAEEPPREPASQPGPARPGSAEFPQALLTQLERCLVKYMGPIGKVLVRKLAAECQDLTQLCRRLSDDIPLAAHKAAFLEDAASLCGISLEAKDSENAPAEPRVLDAGRVAAMEHQLVAYIGPLAKVLVRRAEKNCANLGEMCRALAQHIENEGERQHFLAMFGEPM